MDIPVFINEWIDAANAFNTEKYLTFYQPDAVLDDPSVGRKFNGLNGIKDYFTSYFIGYNTFTKIIHLEVHNEETAHLEVEFTGDFSEGKIGGTFDFKFKNNKISFLKADLLQ